MMSAQTSIVVMVQVNEEGRQAEGEEEQGLEAAPGRAEAGPGQEAEEVCCCSAGRFLGICISQHDISDRSHHLHLHVQATSMAPHLVQHSQASIAC